jgi:hypothetical protein
LGRWRLLRPPTVQIAGFAVFIESGVGDVASLAGRLAAAIDLVGQVSPRRLRRLRLEETRIFIGEFLGAAGYWYGWPKAITFHHAVLIEQPVVWIASALIHEGTHARLRRVGIHSTSFNRARIERRCVREEIAFLRNLPQEYAADAARFEAWSLAALTAAYPWYEPEQRRAKMREALAADGAPGWLRRMVGSRHASRKSSSHDHGA